MTLPGPEGHRQGQRGAGGHTSPCTKGCAVDDVLGHSQEPFACGLEMQVLLGTSRKAQRATSAVA